MLLGAERIGHARYRLEPGRNTVFARGSSVWAAALKGEVPLRAPPLPRARHLPLDWAAAGWQGAGVDGRADSLERADAASPPTLLEALAAMAEEAPEEGMTLGGLLDRLGERAFGASLFVLALPCCIPFLYLVPSIVAVPMALLALQMAAGRTEPWLPGSLRARRISKDGLAQTARRGRKLMGWTEKVARPRLLVLTHRRAEPVIGALLALFCVSIMIPLPMTNTVPGIGVAVASAGLLQRDGLLVGLGVMLGSLWIAMLAIGGEFVLSQLRSLAGF